MAMVNKLKKLKNAMLAIVVSAAVSIPCWLLVVVPEVDKGRSVDVGNMSYTEETILSQVQLNRLREEVAENSRIITELQQGVDMLDKWDDEALERAKDRMRTMRFVPVVVSAYNPVADQTDNTPEITASNKRVRDGMVALSRDLEKEYGFTFGDTVVIEGHGSFVFEDRMDKRWSRRVDILMFSREAAIQFGVQYSFLVVSD